MWAREIVHPRNYRALAAAARLTPAPRPKHVALPDRDWSLPVLTGGPYTHRHLPR